MRLSTRDDWLKSRGSARARVFSRRRVHHLEFLTASFGIMFSEEMKDTISFS